MARRKAKEATAEYLHQVALWYLARYPGSTKRTRDALNKRVTRSVTELGTDPEEGQRALMEVLTRLQQSGLLDDDRFAASRLTTLAARGLSKRGIESRLRQQGIATDVITRAFERAGVDDLSAARTFVRKRRLGTFRRKAPADRDAAAQLRQKDLGKLARAGFSFDVARRALEEEA